MSSPKPAECPHCGYSAGIYVSPRNRQTAAIPLRCLSCHNQAPLNRWVELRKPLARLRHPPSNAHT